MITTFTSREFNQGVTQAKREALKGPVFVTDRGKPAHVLLSIEDYRNLTRQKRNIVDALAMKEGGDIEFEPEKLEISLQPAEFS